MKTTLWGVLLRILVGFLFGAGVTYAAVQYSYEVEVPASVMITSCILGDPNGDGMVNLLDMTLVGQHFGQTGSPGWIPEDVIEDGMINVLDMIVVGQHWTG